MEQTRLQEFFTARKHHSPSVHPSKRRKLDVEATTVSRQAVLNNMNSSSRRKRSTTRLKAAATPIESLLSAKPLQSKPRESISCQDDHGSRMRKTNSQLVRKHVKESNVMSASIQQTNASHSMQLNHWVNEQAKNILHSRGSNVVAPGIAECVSSFSLQHSPTPVADNTSNKSGSCTVASVTGTDANAVNGITISVSSSSHSSRGRLRSKYAHLLKKDVEQTPTIQHVLPNVNDSAPVPSESHPGVVTGSSTSCSSPAHERFKQLVKKEVPQSLPLPSKYKTLVETFRCVDSILFLLSQRYEVCTFEKLKKSVQQMSGRSFDIKHLGMMKTAFPSAFTFRQEKGLMAVSGERESGYQLTIESNFREFMPGKTNKITPTVLITRRLGFESSLLDITRKHHQKFIRKLNLDIPDSDINRWHPRFKLEEVPDIEVSHLPQAPVVKAFSSASDVLLKSRGHLLPKVEKALEKVAEKSASENITKKTDNAIQGSASVSNSQSSPANPNIPGPESSNSSKNKNPRLKGVPDSLLERIRLKERKRMELEMTRDPVKEHRLAMMQRLPEIVRIIKTFFTTEKKVAITLEDCVQKLHDSYGSAISSVQLKEHIELVAELAPKWLTIATVRKTLYVKLAKNTDINNVLNSLKARHKEEECTS